MPEPLSLNLLILFEVTKKTYCDLLYLNSLQCWQHDVKAREKYPRPEGLVTPLVESAVTSEKCGLSVLSASQMNEVTQKNNTILFLCSKLKSRKNML